MNRNNSIKNSLFHGFIVYFSFSKAGENLIRNLIEDPIIENNAINLIERLPGYAP